jgi:hypothetical protein
VRLNPAALLVFAAVALALLCAFSNASAATRAVEAVATLAALLAIGGLAWRDN